MPRPPGYLAEHPLPTGIVGALGLGGYQLLADLALEAVGIAEEDAQRLTEVVNCPIAGSGLDEPVPDGLECLW